VIDRRTRRPASRCDGKVGSNGNDVLAGTDEPDLIEGKGGAEQARRRRRQTTRLEGDGSSNQGNDTLIGGAGDDRLAGPGRANDRLFRRRARRQRRPRGNDELVGGIGSRPCS